MKIAPLHFKINCLAIQQHELINYGNKFATEIYATLTRSRARRRAPAGTGGPRLAPPTSLTHRQLQDSFKSFQKSGSRSSRSFWASFGAPLK